MKSSGNNFEKEALFAEVIFVSLNMRISIVNGPNLNLLGKRETSVYGAKSFDEYFILLKEEFIHIELTHFQSNIEGEIVDYIQKSNDDFILLNAGGYTHTSVAIRDAIAAIGIPVIEIHISNVLAREEFRHTSLIGGVCKGTIGGFGLNSYRLGILSCME